MSREELKKLSVKQLKAKCKQLKLQGYSRKNEDQIIDMILAELAKTNEADDIDELLDGPDESKEDEATDTEDDESKEDEATDTEDDESKEDEATDTEDDESKEDEAGPTNDESTLVVFKKLIKGAFGFNGKTFKGSTFELSAKEAKHKKIVNAIKNGLIKTK